MDDIVTLAKLITQLKDAGYNINISFDDNNCDCGKEYDYILKYHESDVRQYICKYCLLQKVDQMEGTQKVPFDILEKCTSVGFPMTDYINKIRK